MLWIVVKVITNWCSSVWISEIVYMFLKGDLEESLLILKIWFPWLADHYDGWAAWAPQPGGCQEACPQAPRLHCWELCGDWSTHVALQLHHGWHQLAGAAHDSWEVSALMCSDMCGREEKKNCAFCCCYSRESFYSMCWKLLLCEEIRQHCIWTSGEDSHSIKWAITVLSSNSKVCLPLELLKFRHPSDMLARCLSTQQQQQTNWSFDFDPVKKWDTHVKGR